MAIAFSRLNYIQYTGSNSSDCLTYMNDNTAATWTIDSESGGMLNFTGVDFDSNNVSISASTNAYLVTRPGKSDTYPAILASSQFPSYYTTQESLTAVHTSIGIGTVPSLLGGASTNIDVTLSEAFPSTSYTATAALTGGVSLLAALSITNTVIQSASVVRVTVQNTGLLTLNGARVFVVATG